MEDLNGKIISIIIGAIIIFFLQSLGVHKLVANIFGGMSGTLSEEVIKETSNKNEELTFWNITDKCATKKCYEIYLKKYPKGKFTDIAKEKIRIKEPKPYLVGEENNSEIIGLLSTAENKTDFLSSLEAINVNIEFPHNESKVKKKSIIKGKIYSSKNHNFYLVIESKKFGGIYPQGKIHIDTSNNFFMPAIYGSLGYKYKTYVVVTNSQEASTILENKHFKSYGMSNLPPTTRVVGNIMTYECCE